MKKRRREQAPKSRRTADQQQAIMDLRKGSRTTPVPSGTTYKRPKSTNLTREYR